MTDKKEKQFQMGTPVKAWYDKKLDSYKPYSEMSKEELQKCLTISQKREMQLLVKQHVFTKLIEDIDDECNTRGIELTDIPNDYYKNNKMFQAKINK